MPGTVTSSMQSAGLGFVGKNIMSQPIHNDFS